MSNEKQQSVSEGPAEVNVFPVYPELEVTREHQDIDDMFPTTYLPGATIITAKPQSNTNKPLTKLFK